MAGSRAASTEQHSRSATRCIVHMNTTNDATVLAVIRASNHPSYRAHAPRFANQIAPARDLAVELSSCPWRVDRISTRLVIFALPTPRLCSAQSSGRGTLGALPWYIAGGVFLGVIGGGVPRRKRRERASEVEQSKSSGRGAGSARRRQRRRRTVPERGVIPLFSAPPCPTRPILPLPSSSPTRRPN
ncbi:hypothetical protein C8R45DRAFT_1079822, partial [Mycena sanguinolenta]